MGSIPRNDRKKGAAGAEKEKDFLPLFQLLTAKMFNLNGDEAHADECPFCGKNKFYVNVRTGEYKCHSENACGAKGNATTLVRWYYKERLGETADEHYRLLRIKRGLPPQTAKRHGLAWDKYGECWLVAYRSAEGEVLNLTRYYPASGKK
jgi:hypothetical protein